MLYYGLITGIIFGFLLQRGQVLRYDKQVGALLFKDMTVVKFMLAHIVVAMIGVYILYDFGLVKLSLKPTILGGVIIGGLVFGLGWGISGYCPGTSVGALGEGRLDALWSIIGMILGAAFFAELYPFLSKTVLTWGDFGRITLPQALDIFHWYIIAPFIFMVFLLFVFFEKKGL